MAKIWKPDGRHNLPVPSQSVAAESGPRAKLLRSQVAGNNPWWTAAKGRVWNFLFAHLGQIEAYQIGVFVKATQMKFMYCPTSFGPFYSSAATPTNHALSQVTQNYIASNVATCVAQIAPTQIRARFMPDSAQWSMRRMADRLEEFINGLAKLLRCQFWCATAFKDAAITGSGFLKVWVDPLGSRVRIDRLQFEDVLVDDFDCRNGQLPRKLHIRQVMAIDEAIARWPDKADILLRSKGSSTIHTRRLFQAYRTLRADEVAVVEGWYLPIGVKGEPGYQVGRHVVCCSNGDLADEEFAETTYPVIKMSWDDALQGFYGISLSERISGIQRVANRYSRYSDMVIQRHAAPTTFVSHVDANVAVNTKHPLGAVAAIKGSPPVTVVPNVLSSDLLNRMQYLDAAAFKETGLSQLMSHGQMPASIESGAAMREYVSATTQRFTTQEAAYQQLQLDVLMQLVICCKQLGAKAPTVIRQIKGSRQYINWGRVDLQDVLLWIEASASLAKTPAGRLSFVTELMQTGLLDQNEARELLQHPDIDGALGLYNSEIEAVDAALEDALDGKPVQPDPYGSLQLQVYRGTLLLRRAQADGAPEETLDALRTFVDSAAEMQSAATPPPAPALPGAPGMPAGAAPPPMPMGHPMANPGSAVTGAGVTPLSIAG